MLGGAPSSQHAPAPLLRPLPLAHGTASQSELIWDWIFGGGEEVLWEEPPTLRNSPVVVALTCTPPSDDAEQVWVWEYETEEGAHDLYMDTGEEIRFRVVDESFVDTSPTGPSSAEVASPSEEPPKKEAPYTLVVRCRIFAW